MKSMLTSLFALLVTPTVATEPVTHDADDPAIWICQADRSRSLIFATDKIETFGAIYAFDLNGKVVQKVRGLDRPNNCDVNGNLLVASERMKNRLRFFKIDPKTGRLTDATGKTDAVQEPMGVTFYRRPNDGKLFVIASPKVGGDNANYLAQYSVTLNSKGLYDTKLVRNFGVFSGVKEIEALAVDHELGRIYASDEMVSNKVFQVNPNASGSVVLGEFNKTGVEGDHEGTAVTRDYVFTTDQRPDNSVYSIFDRKEIGKKLGEFSINADSTDGIDATQEPLDPRYPQGIFVAMNSKDRNFLIVDMRSVIPQVTPE